MKKSTRVLSLVLAMLMLFSVFSVAASAKEIEVADTSATFSGGQVLYLKPNSNWVQGSAWFAAYIWGSNGSTWAKMESCPRDSGYYKFTAPSGSWNNVIFCRMNPSATALDWGSKWDQTADLTWDGSNCLFTVGSGQWNNATGTWSDWSETPEETAAPVDPTDAPEDPTDAEETPTDAPEDPTEAPTEEPTTPEPPVAMTVYCINSSKWDAVSAYAWNDAGNAGAWPGNPMTKTEETVNGFDVYEITLEGGPYNNIIFNNNGQGSKTDDLTLEEGKYYDVKAGVWYASLDEVPEVDPLATDRYLVGSFNEWSTVADEFKLDAEDSRTGYVTLTLAAETKYEFKVVREGAWTSCATPITGSVEGLTFSSSVSDNATLTTTVAGDYVFSFGLDNSQLSVTYPVAPTEPEATEPEATEPEATEPEATEPEVVIEPGYYLVGTLNGANCWFVDATATDRMFVANEGAEGEYMLDYTFVEGDEIKVVYFDGTEIKTWYKDGDNYGIGAAKAGEATVYFRPEGNADWSYTYFTVQPKEVPVDPTEEPTEEPTDPEATGDQPTVPVDPTEEPTQAPIEEPYDKITIYFQNNWLWTDVRAYFWGSEKANSAEWPGDALEIYDNDGTYDVYYVEVPADIEGIIFNGIKDDGSGERDKTPNIEEGFYDGACYSMTWDNGNAVVVNDISVILPSIKPTEPEPTEPEPTEPEVPVEKIEKVEGVKSESATRNSFTVSWDAAEGVAYYWVFVDGKCYQKTTETTMTVEGRDADTMYEVYVLASFADKTMSSVDAADVIAAYTEGYEMTSTYESGVDSIVLEWEVTDSTKTWIYYGTSADNLKLYASSKTGTYTLSGLDSDTVYYVKLAHLIDGVIVEEDVVEVATLVDENLIVSATESEGSLDLSWNAVDGTYKYWVTVETGEKTLIYSTKETTYSLSGLDFASCDITVKGIGSDGMVYYYPVEA